MKTIWKYTLGKRTSATLQMPLKAKILCVQVQGNEPMIWAEVDDSLPMENRVFLTIGTGWPIEEQDKTYVGTYQLQGGALVFHVFERYTFNAD